MYGFSKPTADDIEYLATNLRAEERVELNRTSALRPYPEVISRAIDKSVESWAIKRDDVLLGITGVRAHNPLSDEACAWLITTEDMKRYPVFFVRNTRFMLDRWHHKWSLLFNFVDADYTASLQWAKAVGFEIKPAVPMGAWQRPFHPIHHWRPQDV